MLKIRYFEKKDRQECISLLQTIFPEKHVDNFEEFWEWEYLSNPNNNNKDPEILVCELDHKIVGILAGIKSKLKVGNSVFDCLWLTDYGTHPDYRGKAGAFKLVRRAMKDFDILLGFGNPVSTIIGKRLGFNYFSVPILANVLSLNNILSRKIKQPWLIKFVDVLWQAFKKIFFTNRPKQEKFKIEEVSFFDKPFNSLWNRVKEDYPVICFRDRDYLQWRYVHVPGYEYKIFGATTAHGLSGYIILRVEKRSNFKTGLIVDLFSGVNSTETLACLLQTGLYYFAEESVDIVKCLQTGLPGYDNLLKKLGFIFHRKNLDMIIKSKSDKVKHALLQDRSNWFISIGDSDIDFYFFY